MTNYLASHTLTRTMDINSAANDSKKHYPSQTKTIHYVYKNEKTVCQKQPMV